MFWPVQDLTVDTFAAPFGAFFFLTVRQSPHLSAVKGLCFQGGRNGQETAQVKQGAVMLAVDVRHLGGVRFEVDARGHRLLCDQPISSGGTDTGMTPPEFLLGALATCAGYYAAEYLKARGLSCRGLRVRVEAEKAANPARLGMFRIAVTTAPIEAKDRDGVLNAVKKCLIHNTLLHAPKIEIDVNSQSAPIPVAA